MTDTPDQENEEEREDRAADSSGKHRRRRKRKVRTRVRIKKKSGPFRKVGKMVEKFIWLLVIVGFIVTMVVLMKQLDISDDKAEKKRKKKKQGSIPQREFMQLAAQVDVSRAWFFSDQSHCTC